MAQFRKCYLEMLNQNQQDYTTEVYEYRQNTFVTMVLILFCFIKETSG